MPGYRASTPGIPRYNVVADDTGGVDQHASHKIWISNPVVHDGIVGKRPPDIDHNTSCEMIRDVARDQVLSENTTSYERATALYMTRISCDDVTTHHRIAPSKESSSDRATKIISDYVRFDQA